MPVRDCRYRRAGGARSNSSTRTVSINSITRMTAMVGSMSRAGR